MAVGPQTNLFAASEAIDLGALGEGLKGWGAPAEKKDPELRATDMRGFALGGFKWSGWIDPESVPVCSHEHPPVDRDLMGKLVKKCMLPQFFVRRCLLSEWKHYETGTPCVIYDTKTGQPSMLWVADAPSRSNLDDWIAILGERK